jgi:hypothetical protein
MDPQELATEEVTGNTSEEQPKGTTARVLDVAALSQLGQGLYTEATAEIDGSKDAIAYPPPLPADKYIVSLHPGKDFIVFDYFPPKSYTNKDGEVVHKDRLDYFNVNVNFRVESFLNENTPAATKALLDNRRVQRFFDQRLSSLLKDGTSEAATFLKYLGYKLNGSYKLEDLAGEVGKAILSGQGRLWAQIDWRAGYVKASQTTENGKVKKTPAHWLVNTMTKFPKNTDGTYNPEIEIDGQVYKARAYVRSFGTLIPAQAAQ